MDDATREAIDGINQRLDSINGIFDGFQTLLHNHMTDYTLKFGELKVAVESYIKVSEAQNESIKTKVDTFKWALVLIALFTGILLTGLITITVWVTSKLIGG